MRFYFPADIGVSAWLYDLRQVSPEALAGGTLAIRSKWVWRAAWSRLASEVYHDPGRSAEPHWGHCCKIATRKVAGMGVSDPELREKLFGPRWVQLQHESEKQRWPRWKRL